MYRGRHLIIASSHTKSMNRFKPWRKCRIGIHSEPIRTIPNHSDICILTNANQSKPIRKTFWISVVEKRLRKESDLIRNFYPNESERIQSKILIRMNQNQSGQEFIFKFEILKPNIQSEWIWINQKTDSFELKITSFSDWFWFIRIENLLLILSDSFRLKSRIESDWDGLIFKLLSEWIRTNTKLNFNPHESDSIRPRIDFQFEWIVFESIRIRSDRSLGLNRINFQAFFNEWDSKRFSDWFGLIRSGLDTDIGMIQNISDSIRLNTRLLS